MTKPEYTRSEGLEHAEAMGLDPHRLHRAFACLDRDIEAGITPGGIAVIGRRGRTITYMAGSAGTSDRPPVPVQPDTLYDCASLTKVVVTLPLVLQLLEQGRLRLDDPVAATFPAFAEAEPQKAAVTIRHLLTHTAGLRPYMNLHAHGWTRDEIVARVLAEPLQHEPGAQVVYSDLGYIVLGELAARAHGLPLAEAAQRHILQPLGMRASGYRPLPPAGAPAPAAAPSLIAPTEWDAAAQAFRIGAVHDENAYAMGGVSGHAGLFATADDLSRYAAMWLGAGAAPDGTRVLAPATVRAAVRSHTGALSPGHRGLGWVLAGDPFDASGDLLSRAAYGHTGFTGTSLYVDPELELTIVLLTNRVHYGREKSVASLRARFHNAVAGSLI
ncbi:serine hydrolase domain-containing protein [Paenibacillus sp. HJGM_3]|uniref:serine hydrolase domain-containing protein n=1 Tax=Paenibacillus sp. HJGM_3 TaxID=3379816 RepID=UPI00385DDE39